MVYVTLMDVAHVPGLSHHLLSLRHIADAGNKHIRTRKGIRIVFVKSGDELFAPSYGQLNCIFAYRTDTPNEEIVHAVNAPWGTPTRSTAADINDFHCSHGHMHEDLLCKTAKQTGVKLVGQLAPCQGCSEAKGIRNPVKPVTRTRRVVKAAERCFVDPAGPKSVQSPRRKGRMMILRDNYRDSPGYFSSLPKTRQPCIFQSICGDPAPQGRDGEE